MLSGGINTYTARATVLDKGAKVEQGVENFLAFVGIKDIVAHNDEAVCIPGKSFCRAGENVI